jgi:hypothetical protein
MFGQLLWPVCIQNTNRSLNLFQEPYFISLAYFRTSFTDFKIISAYFGTSLANFCLITNKTANFYGL